MRILIVGASGNAGRAVTETLSARGHDIITSSRSSGDIQCDITDPAALESLWAEVGQVDAVACAAGEVPFAPLDELGPDEYRSAFERKVLSQINLVRSSIPHVAERGSFTLLTGVLAREPIMTGAAAAMANGAVESYVRSAAIELPPRRINVISPTVFTECMDVYGDFFPGMPPVDLSEVARAYVRSIEGAETGQVYVP